MKHTVVSDRARASLPIPPEAAEAFAGLAARLVARSQLVWGEHCTECAYPACYASCAFYTPRQDLHCRRFEAGIESVAAPGPRLSRIRFRRWGKLEAEGPAGLRPVAAAERLERAEAVVQAGLARLPRLAVDSLSWRWNAAKRARLSRPGPAAEAFVVESWAADGRTHPFTLTILEKPGGAGGMFQAHFEAGAGYGRLVVPVQEIAARVDLSRPYLVQVEPMGEAAGRDVVFGLVDFAAFDGPLPASVRPRPSAQPAGAAPLAKVVVWDLDETLWTGTLAEDGPRGVRPRPEVVAAVRALDERGVLQSIASKNDHDEAMAALEAFGLKDYFLHPQVSWAPKSGAMREIAARLDLGLDAFVFIDDQPFERAEVTETLPQVRSLPHTAVAEVPAHPWFDLPVTAESRGRRAMYQAEAQRSAAAQVSGGDYLAFLRGSGLALDVRPLVAADVERVHELSQRTNQLNFTGAKLGRDAVAALAAPDRDRASLTLRCADRFGDYGLIGFAVLDLAAGRLDAFFMSCRVQRKRVEHAAFAHLAERLAERGHAEFAVRFRRTERNKAAAEMLGGLGFVMDPDAAGWRRPLAQPFPDADVVRLVAGAANAAAA